MLKGKCAIVTGSTSGIGLGIAHALAAAGANVILNGFGGAQCFASRTQWCQALSVGIANRHSMAYGCA